MIAHAGEKHMDDPKDRAQEMLVRHQAMELLPRSDAVIFDVDGVLVDVSGTFRVVICETTQYYCEQHLGFDASDRLIERTETELFKAAGGFNNDWDLTLGVVLLYIFKSLKYQTKNPGDLRRESPTLEEFTEEIHRRGGGLAQAEESLIHQLSPEQRLELSLMWDRKRIVRLFQEMYAGVEHCEQLYGFAPEQFKGKGYADQEEILIDPSLLNRRLKYGLLTGRTLEETRFAIGRAGLSQIIPETNWVTHDDQVLKPDGRALWMAVDRMGCSSGIYIGDTLDDLRTVRNYRDLRGSDRARIIAAVVFSGAAGDTHRLQLLKGGAEILAPDANAILTFLSNVIQEAPSSLS